MAWHIVQCDCACSRESKLRIHLEIHSGKRPYKCNQCEYADVHWRNLGNHQKMHIKRNIQGEANVEKRRRSVFNDLPCLICAKRSANKAGLKDHMRIHMGSQSYPCSLCEKSFSHRNSLSYHLKMHEDASLACTICSKSFSRKSLLNLHLRMHKGLKTFKCNKLFSQS